MGSINKLIKSGIKNSNIEGDALKDGVATTAKFGPNSVESSEINNGGIAADDLASTLDVSSKTVTLPNTSVTAGMLSNTLDLSSKTVTIPSDAVPFDREYNNIALLGFKMATQESLTVFNLVDGVIDEFNDESGTDEAEGSNDNYCASSDFYDNISPSCAAQNTTIVSEPFASGTVPTSSRIVVFQENVDTPTLNTDIIASVSRDGGVTFTAVTLADSGYVTGSSGQRILTGQATISGQPSGQSMRWKLALANNQVKIHGVSLSWA